MSSKLGQQGKSKRQSRGSWLRSCLELSLFCIWLALTGMAGYFIGSAPSSLQDCSSSTSSSVPPQSQGEAQTTTSQLCSETSEGDDIAGLSYAQIKHAWTCRDTTSSANDFDKPLLPSDGKLADTKWNTILSVDPNKFFDMYLTQYPGDTRAVQPVVVFSHKPLKSIDELPQTCKVLDIAIVPDTPGVCVAVTETFHDVASYHMLHADRQPDGTFALTSNLLEQRNLPSEEQYTQARHMLSAYFKHAEYVGGQVKAATRNARREVVVGCVVETAEDLRLFSNSVASALKAGLQSWSIYLFSSNADVLREAKALGVTGVDIERLAAVGAEISGPMRRHFLQAWLAFAVSDGGVRMVWQSPGTVWLGDVNSVMKAEPSVELLWAFKGRRDRRAAPFYVSFDFFSPSGSERPVHLMHELMLHFDLILAWGSLDAVAAYRLSENNARYGTTTRTFSPMSVLHVDVLGRDVVKIKDALSDSAKPHVVVMPHEGITPDEVTSILKQTGLWFI